DRMPEHNLDALRSIAVLCVLINHVANVLYPGAFGKPPAQLAFFDSIGEAGVLIFFVHTSYVLMGSLDRLRAQGIVGGSLVKQFYLRRAFRIYPLAIAILLAVRIFHLPARPEEWAPYVQADRFTFLSNLALTQNLTGSRVLLVPMWSLPIEVQMYVVLPLLAWALRRSAPRAMSLVWLGAVGIAVAMIFGRALFGHPWDVLLYAPCFVAGAIAYHLSRHVTSRTSSTWWLPFLVVLLAAFVFTPLDIPGWLALAHYSREWVLTACVAGGLVLVHDAVRTRLSDVAHTIAKYSYGIYLVHVPVLAIAVRKGPDVHHPAFWPMVVVGIALASWAAYTFVELPGIRLGQHLTRGRATAATYAPAP
ncbi:MAG: acyltransferase, partial [bacterium]